MVQVAPARADALVCAGEDRQSVLGGRLRRSAPPGKLLAELVGDVGEVAAGRAVLAAQTARVLGVPEALDVLRRARSFRPGYFYFS